MKNEDIILDYINKSYLKNCKEPFGEKLPYPYVVPGADYSAQLWDWDSWLTGLALMDIDPKIVEKYVKGSVLNFLNSIDKEGRIPLLVEEGDCEWLKDIGNIHKPCLVSQALEICEKYNDFEWIKDCFNSLVLFISFYEKNQFDQESGLFYWIDDGAIGFDNDPTVFYRPNKSTGSIFLNCLMFNEYTSLSKLAEKLKLTDKAAEFKEKANKLKEDINRECFDDIDGFYYSVDLSLRKINPNTWLHKGAPRHWHSLPIKIKTWAGLLPLTFGIADEYKAARVVKTYLSKDGLYSDFGIRTVAKNEKMYKVDDTGNPSCWLGPIWINANYFTYVGLERYGFKTEANDIAKKTIAMLAYDLEECGEFHEYYDPENGKGIRGKGFQNWNFLVVKLINDLK